MIRVMLNGMTYLSFFTISFRQVSIVINVISIVYFSFRNYHDIDVIFVFDNIVLSFFIKNVEVKWQSFTDGFRSQCAMLPGCSVASSTLGDRRRFGGCLVLQTLDDDNLRCKLSTSFPPKKKLSTSSPSNIHQISSIARKPQSRLVSSS